MHYQKRIDELPFQIRNKMLERQAEQGNKRDITVFYEYITAGCPEGGFTWDQTTEGHDFWYNVISSENIDLFFERYPKSSTYELWI